jgi:hypothetical protein
MFLLTNIGVSLLDSDITLLKNYIESIKKTEINIIYKYKTSMDIYCRSIERDYLHNHGINIKVYAIFKEIPEEIELALEKYYGKE